ncbi:MAG: helix-turn-helix domain-containing protein, partial [Bacteroidetes bacterium]|nr:helix-turn-helix domain-containing protein [Bacteroidota bacterium]
QKQGRSVTEIQRELGRTRPWVYKWIKRYQGSDPEWYLDESREPKAKPNKIDAKLEPYLHTLSWRTGATLRKKVSSVSLCAFSVLL